MKPHRSPPTPPAGIVPPALVDWMSAFRDLLTAPVWNRALVLVAGTVLATGKRTVSQALRVMGLEAQPDFARYHAVLNRACWSSRLMARRLLVMILDRFLPEGEVVLSIDDTIERRWGAKITARGIYRDPVRSSHGHFVKVSRLRWLSLMAVVPVPWTTRRWALPFLTVLAPSERWSKQNGRRTSSASGRVRLSCICNGLTNNGWPGNAMAVSCGDASRGRDFAAVFGLSASGHRAAAGRKRPTAH